MNPIRVLQVLASLDRGGAETMVMNIYRNIDRRRIQFDFVVNDRSERYSFEDEIEKLGGRVFKIPKYNTKNFFLYKRAWTDLLSQHPEWRIVHGHHTSPAFIYLKVAKSFNRITIAHSHIAGGEKTLKTYVKLFMRYPLRYITKHLFACSKPAAEWMFGKRSTQTYILNNAIDAKKFIFSNESRDHKRKELGVENKFVVGHVGRFQTQKNHLFLIDIFKAIHDKNDDAVLLLVGDGELRRIVENKVKELGLGNNVIFTGVRPEIPELLQAMDVFLFPSLYEGLGIVVIEAQAAGLPSIVANTIPYEAYVTNLVESVSLKDSVNKWSDMVLKYSKGYERLNTYEKIKSEGYDIIETSKWLENFYLSNWKE